MPRSIDLVNRVFYVYALFRPNGVICYIGKGKGNRINQHELRARGDTHSNRHLWNIIKNAGGTIPKVIIRDGLLEADSFALEEIFIRAIGIEQDGGPLVNLTYGGEGATLSEETKKILSGMAKKQFQSMSESQKQEWIINQSVAQKARWVSLSQEERERIFDAVSVGNVARWAKIAPEELEEIAEQHRRLAKAQWAKLTPEEYTAICVQRSETFRQVRSAHTPERVAEIVEAHRQASTKAWEDQAKRDKASQRSKEQWADPEKRAYMKAQMKDKHTRGAKWWCTPGGVSYRAISPRSPKDRVGRRYDNK